MSLESLDQEEKDGLLKEKEELIKKLSEIHKRHPTDPAMLCSASLHDFDFGHPDIAQYPILQGQLFQACTMLNEEWTNV